MRTFAPYIIVAQCRADADHADPLTTLGLSIPGYHSLFGRIISLADGLCGGRIVATGGSAYAWATNASLIWALLKETRSVILEIVHGDWRVTGG